jgi:hypothetical protein
MVTTKRRMITEQRRRDPRRCAAHGDEPCETDCVKREERRETALTHA